MSDKTKINPFSIIPNEIFYYILSFLKWGTYVIKKKEVEDDIKDRKSIYYNIGIRNKLVADFSHIPRMMMVCNKFYQLFEYKIETDIKTLFLNPLIST